MAEPRHSQLNDIDLSKLTEIRQGSSLVKLLIMACLVIGMITIILCTQGIASFIAIIFLGLMYAHGLVLQHQYLHNTPFHSKQWNRIVGFLLGLPMLVSYSDYQVRHFRHHKLLGTSEDEEFFSYDYNSLKSVKFIIPHFFMLPHYKNVAIKLYKTITGQPLEVVDATPKAKLRVRNEYCLMLIFCIVVLALTIGVQTTLFVKIWLIPLLFANPTYALIELPEHIGCERQVPDVFVNTRTIKASKLVRWFTDGNNYHVEHHWLPNVPPDRLPEVHNYIESKIQYLDSSYWSFYTNFVQNVYRNQTIDSEPNGTYRSQDGVKSSSV